MSPDKTLVYVDTDVSLGTPGAEIDDGAALILLLRHGLIDIIGASSVFGNVPVRDAALNLNRMLTWLGGERVPEGIGAWGPLIANFNWFNSWQAGYGKTLPWNYRPTQVLAANLLIESIRANPGKVSVLALGPMTNLALATRMDPGIIPLTCEVIAMGGSFNIQDPAPEFNIRCDPEAASIVLKSGLNVHLLGLDITRRAHFSRRDFASLPDSHPALALMRSQAPGWIDRMETMGWDYSGCALHDAVAAAYLVDNSIFKSEQRNIEIELGDPAQRGLTCFSPADNNHPIINIITDMDTAKCRDLIWSTLK